MSEGSSYEQIPKAGNVIWNKFEWYLNQKSFKKTLSEEDFDLDD